MTKTPDEALEEIIQDALKYTFRSDKDFLLALEEGKEYKWIQDEDGIITKLNQLGCLNFYVDNSYTLSTLGRFVQERLKQSAQKK